MADQVISIRPSRNDDGGRAIAIWCAAVDATHRLLLPEDRVALELLIRDFLPSAPLLLAVDQADQPLAFMLIVECHMEALFADPLYRGQGIGALLVRRGLELHPYLTTDVNEQNGQALGFYERLGFRRVGRSEFDGQGRPYPLIHLARSD